MPVAAVSLANLKAPWKPGHSGNPRGRPNSGGSLLEYLDELAADSGPGVALYSVEELEEFGADHRASHTKAMAAQWILLGRTPGFHEKSGKPYCAMLIEMLLDRKIGKPPQTVHVTKTTIPPPAVLAADKAPLMRECFASLPPAERAGLLAELQAMETPALEVIDPA